MSNIVTSSDTLVDTVACLNATIASAWVKAEQLAPCLVSKIEAARAVAVESGFGTVVADGEDLTPEQSLLWLNAQDTYLSISKEGIVIEMYMEYDFEYPEDGAALDETIRILVDEAFIVASPLGIAQALSQAAGIHINADNIPKLRILRN